MFDVKYKKNKVDIYYKTNLQVNDVSWFSISIKPDSIYIYISRDKSRSYWIGRKNGLSSKLIIKFNDKKKMITVNTSNKIIFHNIEDYNKIKEKAIYYKHMNENENKIEFFEN